MLIYLDNCSLQRPLDRKSNPRIHLESEAVLKILDLLESDLVRLVSSEILLLEIERNPEELQRTYALIVLSSAAVHVETGQEVQELATSFDHQGLHPADSLHLASAVHGQADFFCTCDDKLLRRARRVDTSRTRVVSPLELIEEIETWRSS
ncbi:MAG: type II toxin-antitoxin system VapC family toxin [Thermoanaerobaculia bacterium]